VIWSPAQLFQPYIHRHRLGGMIMLLAGSIFYIACGNSPVAPSPPSLKAMRFVAFGDSITSGTIAPTCGSSSSSCALPATTSASERRFLLQQMFANLEVSTAAYPRVLQTLLTQHYTPQAISILNEGSPGEFVADGKARLASTLTTSPQVLLLLEGANDMNQGNPPVDAIAEDLRSMVRTGISRGMTVFLATLIPQRPLACRAGDFCDGVEHTVLLNARVRTIAQAEGATLVDLYPAFTSETATLLGIDGLHPTEAGYRRMADVFFTAISARLQSQ
jgi:lysophospholipase L1-like esterase